MSQIKIKMSEKDCKRVDKFYAKRGDCWICLGELKSLNYSAIATEAGSWDSEFKGYIRFSRMCKKCFGPIRSLIVDIKTKALLESKTSKRRKGRPEDEK